MKWCGTSICDVSTTAPAKNKNENKNKTKGRCADFCHHPASISVIFIIPRL